MGSFCALRKRKRNPWETAQKRPGQNVTYLRSWPKSESQPGGEKRAAKAKKKADKEKAGWGIAFSEFIARAGVGLDGAEEMDAAAMQL